MTSCPTQLQLEAFVAGKETREPVTAHVATCQACAARVQSIREDRALMDELRSLRGTRATQSGIVVDGYDLIAPHGHGAQGSVYLATQRHTRRTVALKILQGGFFATVRQRRRFEREVELAARLRHPCIVTVFDSGTTRDGRHYLAMEYVEGKPLDQYLSGGGPIDIRGIVALLRKICAGIEYAHVRGIIHRDLKPANVLIDAAGEPRIVDFGLAKVADPTATRAGTMTRPGEFAGTFAYASPEQIRGNPDDLDARTDVYSLGVMLYEALVGSPPFDPTQALPGLLNAIEFSPPPSPRGKRSDIDADLETILLKALAKDPARRYQSAADLGRDLDHFLAGRPIDARRDSAMYVFGKTVRRHRWLFAASVALLVLLTGFGLFMSLAYRRAFFAERAAEVRSEEVARLLTTSNIESARALARANSFAQAERLLWQEYFKERAAGPVDEAVSPTRWALRELYFQNRCSGIFGFDGQHNYLSAIHPVTGAVSTAEARSKIIQHRDGNQKLIRAIELDFVPRAIVYPADGSFFITAGVDGKVARVETSTGKILQEFQADASVECRLAISADGKILAMSGSPGTVNWFRADTFERVGSIDLNHRSPFERIVLDARGQRMAAAAANGSLQVIDLQSGTRWPTQVMQRSPVRSMELSSDGKLLITLSDEVRVWDTADPTQFRRLPISPSLGAVAAISQDDRWIAIAQGDSVIHRLSVGGSEPSQVIGGHGDRVHWMQWLRDGQTLCSYDWQQNLVRRWDMNDDHLRTTYATVQGTILSATQIDSRSYAVATGTKSISIYADGKETAQFAADQGLFTVARSKDGTIAAGGILGKIFLWDASGKLLRTLSGHKNGVNSIKFDRAGDRMVSTSQDLTLRIWDVRSGECTRVIDDMRESMSDIRFSPDGRYFAAGGKGSPEKLITRSDDSYVVRVWNAQTGEIEHSLHGHTGRVRIVAFTSDGNTLASGADDGTIRLWNLRDGSLISVLQQTGGTTYGLSFAEDDRLLAAVGTSSEIRIWNIASGSMLASFPRSDETLFGVQFGSNALTTWGSSGTITGTDLKRLDERMEACAGYWQRKR